jgi:membrane protein implicated in regulation of membrane protease activity
MSDDNNTKKALFIQKRDLFIATLDLLEKKMQDNIPKNRNINNILWYLNCIKLALASTDLDEKKLVIYNEILDHALIFCFLQQDTFAAFLKNSPKASLPVSLHRIESEKASLEVLEIIVCCTTVLTAAVPLLMVATVPSSFSMALEVIPAVTILLPFMVDAVLFLAVSILALKLMEVSLKAYSQTSSMALKDKKHRQAERLVSCSSALKSLDNQDRNTFFKPADKFKAKYEAIKTKEKQPPVMSK